jgi:hypothetical protein
MLVSECSVSQSSARVGIVRRYGWCFGFDIVFFRAVVSVEVTDWPDVAGMQAGMAWYCFLCLSIRNSFRKPFAENVVPHAVPAADVAITLGPSSASTNIQAGSACPQFLEHFVLYV